MSGNRLLAAVTMSVLLLPAVAFAVPPAEMYWEGKRYVRADLATFETADSSEVPEEYEDTADFPDGATAEEIAELLRPVTVFDGYEYVGDADVAEAEELLAGEYKNRVAAGSDGDLSLLGGGSSLLPLESGSATGDDPAPMRVIGSTDNRVEQRANTTASWRKMVALNSRPDTSPPTGSSTPNCTATFIGPRTMITAAHCVHNGNKTWKGPFWWSPGVDSGDTQPFPYLPHSSTYPTAGAAKWWCYRPIVPAGWIGSGNKPRLDYAVIEVGCGSDGNGWSGAWPGNVVGWMGWGEFSDSNIDEKMSTIAGYPANGEPSGANYHHMRIWSHSTSSVWAESNYQVRGYYDATGGQSGGPLFNNRYGFDAVFAVHKGGAWGLWDGYYNRARRINDTVVYFVIRNTSINKWW